MEQQFSVKVQLYKRDPVTYKPIVGEGEQKIIERELGTFTFRVPTVRDTFFLQTQRQSLLAQIGNPAFLTDDLFMMAEVHATLPRMVTVAPPGWDWEQIYNEVTLVEIYQAYKEGLEELRKKNSQSL